MMACCPTCVVIGVTYNSVAIASRFVRSLLMTKADSNVSIVLVDNSDVEAISDSIAGICEEDSCVIYLKSPSNLGYLGGANYGYQKLVKGMKEPPDWVIVSNIDIIFKDREFFKRLEELSDIEDLGVISPAIWSQSRKQDPDRTLRERPSRRKIKFLRRVRSNYYPSNMYQLMSILKSVAINSARKLFAIQWPHQKYQKGTFTPNSSRSSSMSHRTEVYAPHGSCVIFSKEYFARGGHLEYPPFLFNEEIFVAETANELQLRVVYNPQLQVWHDEHRSTGWLHSRKIAKYWQEAANHVAETYFN